MADYKISAPGDHPEADAALLAACAEFEAAHQAQTIYNAGPTWDQAEINRISGEWYRTIDCIVDAPRPQTPAGLNALVAAARVAFIDEVKIYTAATFEEQANHEQLLVMAALDSVLEMRA